MHHYRGGAKPWEIEAKHTLSLSTREASPHHHHPPMPTPQDENQSPAL